MQSEEGEGEGETKSKRSALMASAEQMKNEKLATCDIFFTFSRYIFLLLFDTFWGRAQAATHNYAKLKGMLKCPDDPENRKFISKQTYTHTHTEASLLCTSTCEQCDSNKKQLKVPRVLSCRLANVIHTVTTHTHSCTLTLTHTHRNTHSHSHLHSRLLRGCDANVDAFNSHFISPLLLLLLPLAGVDCSRNCCFPGQDMDIGI